MDAAEQAMLTLALRAQSNVQALSKVWEGQGGQMECWQARSSSGCGVRSLPEQTSPFHPPSHNVVQAVWCTQQLPQYCVWVGVGSTTSRRHLRFPPFLHTPLCLSART